MSTSSNSQPNLQPSQHLLSLKVLRAARPTFKHSPLHPSINPITTTDSIQSAISYEPIPNTSSLTLPDSFGVIYLGQTFHGLLSVQYEGNQSDSMVENAILKVELNTTAHKALLDQIKTDRIGFDQNGLELSVKHQIKELGLHTLVCTVFYDQIEPVNSQDLDSSSSPPNPTTRVPRSFRKVYKFQVMNPLSVKTKVLVPSSTQPTFQTSTLPSSINAIFSPTIRNQVYLEVQIQNQSTQPIIFQAVKLIPAQPESNPEEEEETLEYIDLNIDSKTNLLPNSLTHLSINDSNQFLFLISQSKKPCLEKSIQILGRLEISWYSMMGEPGRLMTNPLTRKLLPSVIPSSPNRSTEEKVLNRFESMKFDLMIKSLDYSNIKVGIPFTVTYLIKLSNLPKEKTDSLVLVLQHIQLDDQLIKTDQDRIILPTVSSNSDWSIKESLVSLSSSLLSTNKNNNKRSSTIETKSNWKESNQPKPNRWTINGNFKPNLMNKAFSTPRPMIRNEEIKSDQIGMIRLGPEKIKITQLELENQVSIEYLALEDGLKSLGGFKLMILDEEQKDDREGLIVGEWNEINYVWCKL